MCSFKLFSLCKIIVISKISHESLFQKIYRENMIFTRTFMFQTKKSKDETDWRALGSTG